MVSVRERVILLIRVTIRVNPKPNQSGPKILQKKNAIDSTHFAVSLAECMTSYQRANLSRIELRLFLEHESWFITVYKYMLCTIIINF